MEEGDDFIVFQQAGFLWCGLAEVADQRCTRIVPLSIFLDESRLDVEVGCVAVFALARMEIEVEIAYEATALIFGVPDAEYLEAVVP